MAKSHIKMTVNGKTAEAYFVLPRLVQDAKSPLEQLKLTEYDVTVVVSGGGIHAERIVGKADLRTSGGSISVKLVENALQAHTSGGGVEAAFAGTLKGDCSLGTSGGSV